MEETHCGGCQNFRHLSGYSKKGPQSGQPPVCEFISARMAVKSVWSLGGTGGSWTSAVKCLCAASLGLVGAIQRGKRMKPHPQIPNGYLEKP